MRRRRRRWWSGAPFLGPAAGQCLATVLLSQWLIDAFVVHSVVRAVCRFHDGLKITTYNTVVCVKLLPTIIACLSSRLDPPIFRPGIDKTAWLVQTSIDIAPVNKQVQRWEISKIYITLHLKFRKIL